MEGCFGWKEMDFKNTLLTVKTPESQEQDQRLNPSVPAICGVTKGMTSFVPCFNFTC